MGGEDVRETGAAGGVAPVHVGVCADGGESRRDGGVGAGAGTVAGTGTGVDAGVGAVVGGAAPAGEVGCWVLPAGAAGVRNFHAGIAGSANEVCGGAAGVSVAGGTSEREVKMEGGSATRCTFDFNAAAVDFGNDAVDDGEAEAGAAGVGCEAGLEKVALLFVGHAGAGVGEGNGDGVGGGVGGNGESAAIRHGVNGIEDEVEDGLFDLGAVGGDEGKVGVE